MPIVQYEVVFCMEKDGRDITIVRPYLSTLRNKEELFAEELHIPLDYVKSIKLYKPVK